MVEIWESGFEVARGNIIDSEFVVMTPSQVFNRTAILGLEPLEIFLRQNICRLISFLTLVYLVSPMCNPLENLVAVHHEYRHRGRQSREKFRCLPLYSENGGRAEERIDKKEKTKSKRAQALKFH